MADAKADILSRIENAKVGPSAARPIGSVEVSTRPRHEIVDQFAEYAAEYRANVVRTSPKDVAGAIVEALKAHGSGLAVVPKDLPAKWMGAGVEFVLDECLDYLKLNEIPAVVTGCAVAVAETGTVVLDAGSAQGRRAITLIPDHHVCVVLEDQIVDSVPEAVKYLSPSVAAGQPLTWISGPSATSDIELSRVEGVHGPRHLDILIVSGG